MSKNIVINICGGSLVAIRANFDLKIDGISIFDEDGPEILQEQFSITDDPGVNLTQSEIETYWDNVIVKEFPYIVY